MRYESFSGGLFETNGYVFHAPNGPILFDAPDGTVAWLEEKKISPKLLLLTHGHFDHIQEVAKVKQLFGCPVGCHPECAPMISDPNFFRDYGFSLEVETTAPDFLIEETDARDFLGASWTILEIPGHCAGSLCFFSRSDNVIVGGDVLFAGGVGRFDLPGGDGELLFQGIRDKLFVLNEQATVLSGHGPPTTIGRERATNPFVR